MEVASESSGSKSAVALTLEQKIKKREQIELFWREM